MRRLALLIAGILAGLLPPAPGRAGAQGSGEFVFIQVAVRQGDAAVCGAPAASSD